METMKKINKEKKIDFDDLKKDLLISAKFVHSAGLQDAGTRLLARGMP
jgi:hypothetical protein